MWFTKSAETVLEELSIDPSFGLSAEQALTRLKIYGPNKFLAEQRKSIFLMFFEQLKNTGFPISDDLLLDTLSPDFDDTNLDDSDSFAFYQSFC